MRKPCDLASASPHHIYNEKKKHLSMVNEMKSLLSEIFRQLKPFNFHLFFSLDKRRLGVDAHN